MNPDSGRPITVAPSPPKVKRERAELRLKRVNIGPGSLARLPRDKTRMTFRINKTLRESEVSRDCVYRQRRAEKYYGQ